MTYFIHINSLEELRREYRRLVKANHPDNGGNVETIKIINVEYEVRFKQLENGATAEQKKAYNMAQDEIIREVINSIINLNVEIEICGSWIWVSGNTYGCRQELKSHGFSWASKKKMWFWHDPEETTKSRGKSTMNDIRARYGSEIVKELKPYGKFITA